MNELLERNIVMMKGKKTVRVEDVVNYVNDHLKRTDEYATQKFKAGMCTLVERILMDANRYEGFRYVDGIEPEYEYNREYNL